MYISLKRNAFSSYTFAFTYIRRVQSRRKLHSFCLSSFTCMYFRFLAYIQLFSIAFRRAHSTHVIVRVVREKSGNRSIVSFRVSTRHSIYSLLLTRTLLRRAGPPVRATGIIIVRSFIVGACPVALPLLLVSRRRLDRRKISE